MTCSIQVNAKLQTQLYLYICEYAMNVHTPVYLFYVASYIAIHWLSHCDGIFEAKYTTTKWSAWVEKCSSKLNSFSVAFLEKNLVGGRTLPIFFSSHLSISVSYVINELPVLALKFQDFEGLPIADEALHTYQTPPWWVNNTKWSLKDLNQVMLELAQYKPCIWI